MDRIIVWKDGSHRITDKPTWEAENDPEWLVTIKIDPESLKQLKKGCGEIE